MKTYSGTKTGTASGIIDCDRYLFLVYTASALSAGGKLFNSVFGVDYHVALAIGATVILIYTFMGGFMAVCVTDFIQGSLMLVGLLIVPIAAYFMVGSDQVKPILDQSGVVGGASAYLSLFQNGDRPYTAVEIISQLAWGLGYCGMPHILTRFMAVKNQKELRKSRVIAIIWVTISLAAAVAIGVIGRVYLFPTILNRRKCFRRKRLYRDDHKNVYKRYESAVYRRNFPVWYPGSNHVHSGFAASGYRFFGIERYLQGYPETGVR